MGVAICQIMMRCFSDQSRRCRQMILSLWFRWLSWQGSMYRPHIVGLQCAHRPDCKIRLAPTFWDSSESLQMMARFCRFGIGNFSCVKKQRGFGRRRCQRITTLALRNQEVMASSSFDESLCEMQISFWRGAPSWSLKIRVVLLFQGLKREVWRWLCVVIFQWTCLLKFFINFLNDSLR